MSTFDNIVIIKVLMELTKGVKETDAYKLGVVDENMNVLISQKDRTPEQRESYSYLIRFVFSLKKMLAKIPSGKSRFTTLATALYLIKDSDSIKKKDIFEEIENLSIYCQVNDIMLVEESLIIHDFLSEDTSTNMIGTGDFLKTDTPVLKSKRKIQEFDVDTDTINKFRRGKKKFSKWSDYLDVENNETHKNIHTFAKKHPKGIIILKNGDDVKAIRYNRRGGGSWSKHKRGN